ncbi:MAG: dihydropteroate synthase [Rickettsiales bacterium]
MRIFGVVNLTSDSFSGDGLEADTALKRIATLIDEGADVIDVGAESTRPGASPLSDEEEMARLSPVLAPAVALCRARGVALSLDSYRYASVTLGLECGADYINDVSGGADERIVRAVAARPETRYVFMHNMGVPADKARHMPEGCDVIETLKTWRDDKLRYFARMDVDPSRLVFDPGVGFGKTAAQSATIVERAATLKKHSGVPLLIGHSRKSFLGVASGDVAEKDAATLALSLRLYKNCAADFVRVHNVAMHRHAMRALSPFGCVV